MLNANAPVPILYLYCLIEGQSSVFPVIVQSGKSVGMFKEDIQDECNEAKSFNAKDLELWKVDINLDTYGRDKHYLKQLRGNHNGNEALKTWESMSYYWPEQPHKRHLHVIVTIPPIDDGSTYLLEIQRPVKRLRSDDDQRPVKRLRYSDEVDEEKPMTGKKIFKNTPKTLLREVSRTVQRIIETYRPTMQKLVANDGTTPLIPSWIPTKNESDHPEEKAFRKYIKKLAIPKVQDSPSLLLHELGIEADKKESEHIADIFSLSEHTVLINTSGSGKTRLGLRGLCQNWGFYAVVRQGLDGIGSDDFGRLMDDLDDSVDSNEAKRAGILSDAAVVHMKEKAHHRILQFLLSRFYLLNLLVDESLKCRVHPEKHRVLWVLLQALPTEMFGRDAFLEVAETLQMATIEDIKHEIETEYSRLKHILEFVDPTTGQLKLRPLYCFLDEIQVATESRKGEFRSDNGKIECPLLRQIWSSLTRNLGSTKMLLIVSGTGIDSEPLEDTLNSSSFKIYRDVKRDIGAFDDPDAQRQYIERYIPNKQCPAWEAFLERAWGWCRGRYRNTATLIELILVAGRYSPHKALDAFVKKYTNFTATDGQRWCADEPELGQFNMKKIKPLYFERLTLQQIDMLCNILSDQKIYGCYSLKPFAPQDKIDVFIQYGFARTKSKRPVIDEPLAIMAVWNWLDKNGHFSLLHCLQREIGRHATRKNGFKAYLAFYVQKVFEKAPKLDDVFTFRSDFACKKDEEDLCWQTEKFELVAVSITANTKERKISVITPSCGPSSNVGFLAPNNEDVLDWISENKEHYAFCFPTESAGPDIFFYIRSRTTQKLVLVAIQTKRYEKVGRSCLMQGVRTVTPSWFWKSKDTKYQSPDEVQSSSSDTATRFCDALPKTDSIIIENASYPILRVFASWPADAQLDRTLKKTSAKKKKNVGTHDSDPHPLATLHLENFNNIDKMLGKTWYMGDTEKREVNFAKGQCRDKDQLQRSKRIQARIDGEMEMLRFRFV